MRHEPVVVDLQEHDALDGGFTDIEILTADLHAIVEAKRGWALRRGARKAAW